VEYTTKSGSPANWTFASRKQNLTATVGKNPLTPDAVVIIPLLKDGRKRKLVTIKEFRIPLGDYEYALPAGLYDHNETAEEVAKRELKEETGLKLAKILYVSPPCVSSAGLSDESVVYVVCECTGAVSTAGNETSEDISVEILDLDGVRALRKSSNKISAKTLPFLFMFDAMNKIAWPKHLQKGFDPAEGLAKGDPAEGGYKPVEEFLPEDEKKDWEAQQAEFAKGITQG
jgi:ADP-ribose pyrophosphatase